MAEKATENLNNDELRYFIGEDEFKDNVQKWKEVRYYYFSSAPIFHKSYQKYLPERKRGKKSKYNNFQFPLIIIQLCIIDL